MNIDGKIHDIRGILFDVDGTFVNSKKEIPDGVRQIIPEFFQKQYKLGVCTGRSHSEIKRYILPLFKKDSLHVTDDGGQLITSTGEVINETLMPSDLVKQICRKAEELGVDYGFGHQGVKYFNQPFLAHIQSKDKWQKSLGSLNHLDDWSTPCLGIYNLNDKMKDFLLSLDKEKVELVESKSSKHRSTYIKLANKGVNKGSALKKWANYHQLNPDQIMMIGDSHNDLKAMEAAGLSIAVANGVDIVKKNSDVVIGDVDDDGLAKFLTKFLARVGS